MRGGLSAAALAVSLAICLNPITDGHARSERFGPLDKEFGVVTGQEFEP